jgi:hypothetical protein
MIKTVQTNWASVLFGMKLCDIAEHYKQQCNKQNESSVVSCNYSQSRPSTERAGESSARAILQC